LFTLFLGCASDAWWICYGYGVVKHAFEKASAGKLLQFDVLFLPRNFQEKYPLSLYDEHWINCAFVDHIRSFHVLYSSLTSFLFFSVSLA
jgi:hypothetical protein